MPRSRFAIAAAVIAGSVLASGQASAQDEGNGEISVGTGTALDRYEPSPYGDELMGLPNAHVWGHLRPAIGAMFNGSYLPLVIEFRGEPVANIVQYQLMVHAMASVELFERLKLDINVPFTVSQDGEPWEDRSYRAVKSGFAPNDIRVGARVEVLKQNGYWPSAALAFDVWLPAGDQERYTSTGETRYAPSIVVSGDYEDFMWTSMLSRRFQSAYSGNESPTPADRAQDLLGSEVRFGVGGGPRFGDLLVSAEVFGSVVTQGVLHPQTDGSPPVNLEAHLGARYDLGPLRLRLAGGPGLTRGAGTPTFRGVFSVGYVMEVDKTEVWHRKATGYGAVGEGDAGSGGTGGVGSGGTDGTGGIDGDGGSGSGRVKVGPRADRDGDGVPDAADACPRKKGDPANTSKPGCPIDTDGDGAPDAQDACPKVPGARSSDAKEDGCPPDTDGDGLRDPDDACPREAGKVTDDPKTTGCLEAVRVVGSQIVILQKVEFETNRALIKKDSESLLKPVAAVMRARPEIVRLAVEGHTDSTGSEQGNIELSQRRAVAVMLWLVDHKIDPRRLEARGFGPRRPIADNGTQKGRAANRRVQFEILKRDPRGVDAWIDGQLDNVPVKAEPKK